MEESENDSLKSLGKDRHMGRAQTMSRAKAQGALRTWGCGTRRGKLLSLPESYQSLPLTCGSTAFEECGTFRFGAPEYHLHRSPVGGKLADLFRAGARSPTIGGNVPGVLLTPPIADRQGCRKRLNWQQRTNSQG